MVCGKTNRLVNPEECHSCDQFVINDKARSKFDVFNTICKMEDQIKYDPEVCANCADNLEPCNCSYSYHAAYTRHCKSCNGCKTKSCK